LLKVCDSVSNSRQCRRCYCSRDNTDNLFAQVPRTTRSHGMAPSADEIAYLYHHVVLPPKLPQKDDNSAARERALIEVVIEALGHLRIHVHNNHIQAVTAAITTIQNLRDSRKDDGNVSEVQLEALLAKLTRGETDGAVPLEIKAQNAGILISRSPEYLNFEFFELSPTNEVAMRALRLTRTFPGSAARIPIDKMANKNLRTSIAGTIAKMTTQPAPGFQPQSRKNGNNEDETRDTTAPDLVTDFLLNVITALGEVTDMKGIVKSTREDVLWSNCKRPWRRSPLWLMMRASLQLLFTRNSTNPQDPGDLFKAFMIFMLTHLLDLVRMARAI
jgi:hypothetical protein